MIKDPYRVLGVSPDCTDEELKKAYRAKSKAWHPDQHLDNEEYAKKRFQEVQEAYRQIVDARAHGASGYGQEDTGSYQAGRGYADYNPYGGFADFFRQWEAYSAQQRENETQDPLAAAAQEIRLGRYAQARTTLTGIAESARDGRWYYLWAVASWNLGSNVEALEAAKHACDLDPDNAVYQNLLSQMQRGGRVYEERSANYSPFGSDASSWCLSMCALNLFCNLCIGGRMC